MISKIHIAIVFLVFIACNDSVDQNHEEDPIVASVFDNNLYYSAFQPMLQQEATPEDSIQYARAIIEKWVRDAILMHEAEKNIPADLDIQKMVDDYRSSLILMNYTQNIVHSNLDTFISEGQLNAYYEENKSQFKLEEPVVQCFFTKINEESEELDNVEKLWKDRDYEGLASLDEEIFEIILDNQDQWISWKDINSLIPKSFWSYNEVKDKNVRMKSEGGFKYFLKIYDSVDKNETPPLSYIEDQAKKVILHKRQTELLDKLKEDLYNKYAESNNVKINF